ncbi:hypothetical protein GFK26_22525 [Variovorax paradoxus]|uniref:Uncharacterized protein n=2 Tax=Variovorax paradoxus TaxID=34073 RepID=A0A5Q0MAA2_VARPD|nr:hypothetical protein GFK26_22525 [Variovorax paradoxus]
MTQAELFFPRPAPPPSTVFHFHEPAPMVLPEASEKDELREAFSAKLIDYPHSSADAVRIAEQRFRRELEKQLGADVLPVMRAFQNASESSDTDLTKTEIALAARWIKAYDAARKAGFRDLGDTDEAYFEVKAI